MPDGLIRLHHSGQAHFLTFSCYGRKPLLAEMEMESAFLDVLERARRRFAFCVWGYVVMPEHVHLLISEPSHGTLAHSMQALKSNVSIEARKRGRRKLGRRAVLAAPLFRSQREELCGISDPASIYPSESGEERSVFEAGGVLVVKFSGVELG